MSNKPNPKARTPNVDQPDLTNKGEVEGFSPEAVDPSDSTKPENQPSTKEAKDDPFNWKGTGKTSTQEARTAKAEKEAGELAAKVAATNKAKAKINGDKPTQIPQRGKANGEKVTSNTETGKPKLETNEKESKTTPEEKETAEAKVKTPESELSRVINEQMKTLKGKPSIGNTIKALMTIMAALRAYFKYIKVKFNKMMGKETPADGAYRKKQEDDPRTRVRSMLAEKSGNTLSSLKKEKGDKKIAQDLEVTEARSSLIALRGSRPAAQSRVDVLEKDPKAQKQLAEARLALSQIDARITAAQTKLATVEAGLQETKSDINDIDAATAKSKADAINLNSLFNTASINLENPETQKLADVFGAIKVKPGENGIDIELSIDKDGTKAGDVLRVFKKLGSDLTKLGLNENNQIVNPIAFVDALTKIIKKPSVE